MAIPTPDAVHLPRRRLPRRPRRLPRRPLIPRRPQPPPRPRLLLPRRPRLPPQVREHGRGLQRHGPGRARHGRGGRRPGLHGEARQDRHRRDDHLQAFGHDDDNHDTSQEVSSMHAPIGAQKRRGVISRKIQNNILSSQFGVVHESTKSLQQPSTFQMNKELNADWQRAAALLVSIGSHVPDLKIHCSLQINFLGVTYNISVDPTVKVKHLRNDILMIQDSYELSFGSTILESDKTLADYKITHGDVINVSEL